MLEICIYIYLQSQAYLCILRVYPYTHRSSSARVVWRGPLLVRRQPELALLRRAVRARVQPVGDRERDDVAQRRDHVRVVVREHLRAALPRRRRRMWDWASPRRCNRRPPRGDAAVHVATTYNGGASPPRPTERAPAVPIHSWHWAVRPHRTAQQHCGRAARSGCRAILLTSWITPSTDALSQIGMQRIALLRKPAPDAALWSTMESRGRAALHCREPGAHSAHPQCRTVSP